MLFKNTCDWRHSLSRSARQGLSLIEIMIALTMTLIVLGALITVFSRASLAMSHQRALIEMHNRLRTPADLLRGDLERVSVQLKPWALESSPGGYFEYIEGPRKDASEISTTEAIRGDIDDILAMTVHSDGTPFTGRWVDASGEIVTIKSNMAEIIWYADFADRNGDGLVSIDEPISVYRRVLLIRPDLAGNLRTISNAPLTPQNFFLVNDISVSFATGVINANSSEDLSRRENRFGHALGGLPVVPGVRHIMDRDFLRSIELNETNLSQLVNVATGPPTPNMLAPLIRQFAGIDLVIEDVQGFDVQIWSPNAPVYQANLASPNSYADNVMMEPDDAAYAALITGGAVGNLTNSVGLGSFVDLGYGDYLAGVVVPVQYSGTPNNSMNSPWFSTQPNPKSMLRYQFDPPGALEPPFPAPATALYDTVYDTFSTHSESNNIDDDGDGLIDEGSDGLDNDGINGVDDVGERELEPPYPYEARGFKVTMRLVHRESAQVHQKSVVQSYVRK